MEDDLLKEVQSNAALHRMSDLTSHEQNGSHCYLLNKP